jgi:hypothetical protein
LRENGALDLPQVLRRIETTAKDREADFELWGLLSLARQSAPSREKGSRRDLKEVRERVARWMEGRKGQKLNAGDLAQEFPELQGTSISFLVKPLVASGKVHTDTSDGAKRLKYFVPEG